MPQHIVVTEYSPRWPELFAQEAERIRNILGDICLAVHHIGSTAVPGIKAKPIVDILPVVTDIQLVDRLKQPFEAIGYEYLGEFGILGRRYLRKGGEERTHQVHIFDLSHPLDIERHLAVRDYLRCHPLEAEAYGALKEELARRYPYDIDGYCDGKDAFVRELEQKALQWSRAQTQP